MSHPARGDSDQRGALGQKTFCPERAADMGTDDADAFGVDAELLGQPELDAV
ncbi:hypothetical protein [Bosea sp. AAP35]|uniref:hypothetical protein n=1 Tax=Bosea sp. AAP35 TaxID=1523417 RepID=UPI0020BF80EB|nr:hypothetical protein [Bosea sp. AAP35]